MTTVTLGGKAVRLGPATLLGQGGEAEVHDLCDGTVLKWWKPADHPDFAGDPQAQAMAQARLDERQHKLPAFPAGLPPQVVTPCELAFADKAGRKLAGYRMRKVSGVPMHHLGEPRWRREQAMSVADALAPARALADAVSALHQRGVVIGDFNDLNVLVDGGEVHLIDADSYQFGPYGCPMFSERFLDPRLCAGAPAGQLLPAQPHDRDSDWFAFHVMLTRALLLVGPWGGVYQPADPARRCTPTQRVLRRISIFEPEVALPRAAAPLATLPEELGQHLREVFGGLRSGPLPARLWAELRFVRCASCGLEHARRRCPACAVASPPVAHHGKLRVQPLSRAQVAWLPAEVTRLGPGAADDARGPALWLDGPALWRRTALGRERIGEVLGGQTWAFAGSAFGAGFYRAGGYCVGFVFDPRRGVLDDRLRLPALQGELVAVHGAVAADRAWLWLTLSRAGRLSTVALVLGAGPRGATLLAHQVFSPEQPQPPWLAGVGGACAVGPHLFVPTDLGVVRLELDGGELVSTRTFPETAPWLCAGDRLVPGPSALDVLRRHDALRLFLS